MNPTKALWDPKFAGTPEQGGNAQSLGPRTVGIGNNSYAHCTAFGGKRARWSATGNTTEATWGNRGPAYQGTTAPTPVTSTSSAWKLSAAGQTPPGVDSVTLAIHGGRKTWEGNIGYNDAHVEFETRPDPTTITYKRAKPPAGQTAQSAFDNLFVDETDDVTGDTIANSLVGSNQFLAMISRVDAAVLAGAAPSLKLFKD